MDFTVSELKKLAEFRDRVAEFYNEPNEKLIAWLRAREMDVDRAEQMLRRHLVWRNHNEIEKLATWKSPKVLFPYLHLGSDYGGAPVFLLPIGRWDFRSCIENGDIVPALRFVYQTLETIVSTAHAKKIYQGIIILDFDGFGYRQLAHRTVIQGILEVVRVFEANYPEVLQNAFTINAPKIFNILFTMIRPMLHSRTLAKLSIFNDDKTKWREALFKLMPKDVLPVYWGGTRPGSDEFCSEDWFQEPLPQHFVRKLSTNYDEFGDEWFTVKVAAGERLTFVYKVQEGQGKRPSTDSVLKWAFYTDSYDIGFGVSNETTGEIHVPNTRVSSHLEKQFGSLTLGQIGKYVLEFDNSFSRSRSKLVHYSIMLTTNSKEVDGNVAADKRSRPGSIVIGTSVQTSATASPPVFTTTPTQGEGEVQYEDAIEALDDEDGETSSSSSGNYSDPENCNSNLNNGVCENKNSNAKKYERSDGTNNGIVVVRM